MFPFSFADIEFIPVNEPFDCSYELPDLKGCPLFSWPYTSTKPGYLPTEHKHIPENEIVIRWDSQIVATYGKVGVLDELMIVPDHHIMDYVVRVG